MIGTIPSGQRWISSCQLRAWDAHRWSGRQPDDRLAPALPPHPLTMTEILMIVACNEVGLYSYVRREFAGDNVEVVMDRRRGERRRERAVPDVEQRQADRRAHRVDDGLKAQGWVVVNAGQSTGRLEHLTE